MATALVYHPDYLNHDTGFSHPEKPDRLMYLLSYLKEMLLLDKFVRMTPTRCDPLWLERVHPHSHIEALRQACTKAPSQMDPDTLVSTDSFYVAHLAASGVIAACDAVMAGQVQNAFCAVRPPGHHAEKARSMGFCLMNNVAIGARYLQQKHQLKRVLIVDWDAHHGNGTQQIFDEDPNVFYFSTHQHPFYPDTGFAEATGKGAAVGTKLNVPLPAGSGDQEILSAIEKLLVPAVTAFKPEFILISAGFDAHHSDPLADLKATEEGFAQMTAQIRKLADEHCQGRIVSVLEGGYDLHGLPRCVASHLQALL